MPALEKFTTPKVAYVHIYLVRFKDKNKLFYFDKKPLAYVQCNL
jgi:hypothetical protein